MTSAIMSAITWIATLDDTENPSPKTWGSYSDNRTNKKSELIKKFKKGNKRLQNRVEERNLL